MRIRYENILAVIFLVIIIYLLVGGGSHISAMITEAMNQASRGPHQRVIGLMALGMILISVVAIVKIIVSRPK